LEPAGRADWSFAGRRSKALSMKRVAMWTFYAVSVLAILYVALHIYLAFSGPHLTPGEPIRIFRRPDAPSYS
jgi:hypothetical protein